MVGQQFPKIICVGKNYLKHVIEMGGTQIPEVPMLFLKPWSSLAVDPQQLKLKIAAKHRIDHELELGVFIKKGGSNISKENAMEHVGGYFLALDLTDRDLQKVAKEKGFPWSLSKGQDGFCPVSQPIMDPIDPYKVELELKVNGQVRQKDMASGMHFKIDELISYSSQFMTLTEGDLILTGTPEGVGPITIGDKIEGKASYEGKVVAELNFSVIEN